METNFNIGILMEPSNSIPETFILHPVYTSYHQSINKNDD